MSSTASAPDFTGLLQYASHAMTNRLAAALAEVGLTPAGTACCCTRSPDS